MKMGGILAIAILVLAGCLWCGGWNNTLIGCRAIGMGGAFIAVADDPSAIFYNPAGIVFQENGFNFSVNGFYILPTHEYVSPAGLRAESKFNTSIPQLFATYRMSERITLGFGVFIPYAGGGVDWKKETLGYPLKSTLGIVSFTPTVAYHLSERVSLGLTLNYYKSLFTLNTEMDPFGPIEVEESGSALSAGASILFRPGERTALGLSVRGPARMHMEGKTAVFYDIYKINLESATDFSLPWDFEVGFAFRPGERFLVSAAAQYTMWSTLDKVDKSVKNIPLSGDLHLEEVMNFRNILILRAGVEYLLPQGIAFRAGVGFDRSAAPKETLSLTNIDVNKLTLLGGIGYRTGRMRLDFVYAYGLGEERERESVLAGDDLKEKFNLNVLILGMGVTFSF